MCKCTHLVGCNLVFTENTGQIQFKVLTTLPLKFKGFKDNNGKSKMTVW